MTLHAQTVTPHIPKCAFRLPIIIYKAPPPKSAPEPTQSFTERMWPKMKLRYFFKDYAPDFMWCTAFDLFIMAEQIPCLENTTDETFKVTLCNLTKRGWFITKRGPDYGIQGKSPRLYLRNRRAYG